MPEIHEQAPLALIACSDVWMSQGLESVFVDHGYLATLTRSGKQALALTKRSTHDVVILDEALNDLSAVDVCRALRDDTLFDHSTPVVLTSPRPVQPAERVAAYAAGAWEFHSHPIDVETLFLKLGTFLRARGELASTRSQLFIDAATGLYTTYGLQNLAGSLGARALRKHEPFACVAFSAEPTGKETRSGKGTPDDKSVDIERTAGFADMASVFRAQSRKSDIVGHVGASRLAILAPDTDAAGARLLVARLQREIDKAAAELGMTGKVKLRAGFSAVSDFAAAHLDVTELVHRAETALDQISTGNGRTILSFEELPPS